MSGLNRVLSVENILTKRYSTFDFRGAWHDAFGNPERVGTWFIWGNSGNGKTSFVLQLCKELCRFDRVLFDSLEEGTALTMRNSLERFGLMDVNGRLAFVQEDMEALKERLRKRKSFRIVVVDSFQYTGMGYRDYLRLRLAFPDKLFIFLSHAAGKSPKGGAAVSVMYDATLKIWVEGYTAFSNGRFYGPKKKFVIWKEQAEEYWNGRRRPV